MVSMSRQLRRHVHLTHWGAAEIESDGCQLTSVRPWREDPAPSRILENLAGAHRHPARIGQPHIRQGWLEHGPGAAARGNDVFVPVSWATALDLLAEELRRVYADYGPDGVFGGSYGWASAGRFHHAQSQLHRFLNCLGGYVRSVNTYSYGTSQVLLPHVVGDVSLVMAGATAWPVIAEHTDLIVAFGGLSPKNSAVASGGIGRHTTAPALASAVARGCRLVSVSPLRSDTDAALGAEWIAPVPGSDVALMLALCHVLDSEGLADRRFLDRYTVGYPRFAAYVRGDADGVPKTPAWAAALTGVAAERIRGLARQMAAGRTLVTVSWSLQRAEHGEQPVWLGLVLAAMLGQIGLPGGGFGHGYGSSGDIGNPRRMFAPRFPQGANGIDSYIPVARIADMLLHPGAAYDYDGQRRRYPDVKLVYWCGGNPFHHHQDLARLREAFARPQTVVVHDPFWTASARHADIVLPSTMSVERDDIGAGSGDSTLFAMPQLTEPHGQARDDYATFGALADRLRVGETFTEGRTGRQWLRHLYEQWRSDLKAAATRCRRSRSSGRPNRCRSRCPTPARCCCPPSGAIPDGLPSAPPAGRSRSSRRPSTALGIPTAPGTRSGSSRPNGSAAPPVVTPSSWWPTSRAAGCTASSMSAPTARKARSAGASRSRCIQTTRPHGASPTARASASSTTAAAAWPGSRSPRTFGPASCSCPPAPGTTPTPATRPSAATATRTCSPPTGPAPRSPRAPPASSPWSRSNRTPRCRPRSRSTARRC